MQVVEDVDGGVRRVGSRYEVTDAEPIGPADHQFRVDDVDLGSDWTIAGIPIKVKPCCARAGAHGRVDYLGGITRSFETCE